MPTYQYRCQDAACAHQSEVRQAFTEAPWTVCPRCGQSSWVRVFWEREGAPRVLRAVVRSTSTTRHPMRAARHATGGHATGATPLGRRVTRPLEPYPHGDPGRALASPYVTHERDGSETVYTTEGGAYRGELDRTGSHGLAARNLQHIRRLGYVTGTRAAAFKDAIRGVPKGTLPGSV